MAMGAGIIGLSERAKGTQQQQAAQPVKMPDGTCVKVLVPLAAQEFFLLLPRDAVTRGRLATGDTVQAQQRAYGLAFAAVTAQGAASPFFLVLDDAWYRELDSRPVSI